jgi:hypothetical protein
VIYLRAKEKKGKLELIICFKVSLPVCLPSFGGGWGLGLGACYFANQKDIPT